MFQRISRTVDRSTAIDDLRNRDPLSVTLHDAIRLLFPPKHPPTTNDAIEPAWKDARTGSSDDFENSTQG